MKHAADPQPDQPERPTSVPSLQRRGYRRPQLVEYGPLAKLTRGTRSGTGEITPQGIRMKSCL